MRMSHDSSNHHKAFDISRDPRIESGRGKRQNIMLIMFSHVYVPLIVYELLYINTSNAFKSTR